MATEQKSKSKVWPVIFGVLVMIAGIFALGAPFVASAWSVIIIGAMLMVGSIFQVVNAIMTRREGGLFFKLLLAVIYFVCGTFLLNNPIPSLLTITLIIGIFMTFEGIFQIVMSFSMRHVANWWTLTVKGVLTLLLGLIVWTNWPISAAWTIGVFVGVDLLFMGIAMMTTSEQVSEQYDIAKEANKAVAQAK